MLRMAFHHRRYYNRCNILIPTTSIPIVNSTTIGNQIISNQRTASTTQSNNRDLYKILGVNRTASQQEIKKAFYTASKKYHPDVVGSNVASANKFLEVKEAYDILKDEQKRREYDRQRDAAQQPRSAYNQQHYYTRQSNHQRTRTMDREMDSEFYRIWRTMQDDPEFQQAARQFREAQRRMQQEAWERQQQRREGMFTNNGNEPTWEEEQMKKGREVFQRIIIIWAIAFLVVVIFSGLMEQKMGRGTRVTRRDLHDPDRRRIEEMMKKMP